MKTFQEICMMKQREVKDYMKKYLAAKQYDVISEDGFLYAKGEVPVLLVAHMDTVHEVPCVEFTKVGNRITSPQGIGGDDRCGIFIIANILKDLKCSVLLCEDEEVGCLGAKKFADSEYIKDLGVNYMIEFDRHGSDDAVFYSCDNQDFTEFVIENTGFKEALGTFSDIAVLMPASKLCGVNLSSGYYWEHTKDEYVMYNEMMSTMDTAKFLIATECPEPFKYKARTYNYNYNTPSLPPSNDSNKINRRAKNDLLLELEVVIITAYGDEEVLYGTGTTKAECWLDIFSSYTSVCFDNVIDYNFS